MVFLEVALASDTSPLLRQCGMAKYTVRLLY